MTQGKKLITCRVCHHDKCREGIFFAVSVATNFRYSSTLDYKDMQNGGLSFGMLTYILCY